MTSIAPNLGLPPQVVALLADLAAARGECAAWQARYEHLKATADAQAGEYNAVVELVAVLSTELAGLRAVPVRQGGKQE